MGIELSIELCSFGVSVCFCDKTGRTDVMMVYT